MLTNLLREAREAALSPRDYFGRAPAEESWKAPAGKVAAWFLVTGLVNVVISFAVDGFSALNILVNLVALALFPVLGVAAGFLGALVLHAAWKALGGKASLQATWRAVASVAFTMPFLAASAPLGLVAFGPLLWSYSLLAYAGMGVHGLSKGRSWGVAAALAATLLPIVLLT